MEIKFQKSTFLTVLVGFLLLGSIAFSGNLIEDWSLLDIINTKAKSDNIKNANPIRFPAPSQFTSVDTQGKQGVFRKFTKKIQDKDITCAIDFYQIYDSKEKNTSAADTLEVGSQAIWSLKEIFPLTEKNPGIQLKFEVKRGQQSVGSAEVKCNGPQDYSFDDVQASLKKLGLPITFYKVPGKNIRVEIPRGIANTPDGD